MHSDSKQPQTHPYLGTALQFSLPHLCHLLYSAHIAKKQITRVLIVPWCRLTHSWSHQSPSYLPLNRLSPTLVHHHWIQELRFAGSTTVAYAQSPPGVNVAIFAPTLTATNPVTPPIPALSNRILFAQEAVHQIIPLGSRPWLTI